MIRRLLGGLIGLSRWYERKLENKREREISGAQEMEGKHGASEQIFLKIGARVLILQQLLDLILEEMEGFEISEALSAELKSQFHDFVRWEDTSQADFALRGVKLRKVQGKSVTLFVHKEDHPELFDDIFDVSEGLQGHGHGEIVEGFRIAACRVFQLELLLYRLVRETRGLEFPRYLQEHLTTQFDQRPKLTKPMFRLAWRSSILTVFNKETGNKISFDDAWSLLEEEMKQTERLKDDTRSLG